jgi:asparagine synthase (glutamine-hydrolysing)
LEPHLPHDIMYRPKMGFSVPLARWFRGPLKDRLRQSVLGSRLADTGIFDPSYLAHLVQAHQSGARDYSAPLWSLLMFDAFLGQVMDGGASFTMPSSAALAAAA